MSPDLPPENQPAPPSNGKIILLAEDDPFISRMYQIKLVAAGFDVHMVTNGRDAYEQFKVINPDLAMMDINMPEMTGFQVVKALQSEGVTKLGDKVIVLTNSANPKDRSTAEQLGVRYLVKAELTPREVLQIISERLGIQPAA